MKSMKIAFNSGEALTDIIHELILLTESLEREDKELKCSWNFEIDLVYNDIPESNISENKISDNKIPESKPESKAKLPKIFPRTGRPPIDRNAMKEKIMNLLKKAGQATSKTIVSRVGSSRNIVETVIHEMESDNLIEVKGTNEWGSRFWGPVADKADKAKRSYDSTLRLAFTEENVLKAIASADGEITPREIIRTMAPKVKSPGKFYYDLVNKILDKLVEGNEIKAWTEDGPGWPRKLYSLVESIEPKKEEAKTAEPKKEIASNEVESQITTILMERSMRMGEIAEEIKGYPLDPNSKEYENIYKALMRLKNNGYVGTRMGDNGREYFLEGTEQEEPSEQEAK